MRTTMQSSSNLHLVIHKTNEKYPCRAIPIYIDAPVRIGKRQCGEVVTYNNGLFDEGGLEQEHAVVTLLEQHGSQVMFIMSPSGHRVKVETTMIPARAWYHLELRDTVTLLGDDNLIKLQFRVDLGR